MTKVFAFPPVGVIARYWTQELPTNRSRSILRGSSYVSATQRGRIIAGLDVHGRRHYGSGYLEALWRMLDGGVHLVRLSSCKIPWGATIPDDQRGGRYFNWTVPSEEFSWTTPPDTFTWLDGGLLPAIPGTIDGVAVITVTGLPPNARVAIPGEFVTITSGDDPGTAAIDTVMIASEAWSNAAGVAYIKLVRPAEFGGYVSIGSRETGVFEIISDWPKAARRAGMTDNYTLAFRQVYPDERGPFEEIYPWN